MPRFQVRETYTNATTNTRFGESDGWIDAYATTRGEVFRNARSEYGAPVSTMYRDVRHVTVAPPASVPPFPAAPSPASERTTETWTTESAGWVFRKRMVYEDARPECYRNHKPRYRANDYYLREVWVEVREIPDISAYWIVGDCGPVASYDVASGEVASLSGDLTLTASGVTDAVARMRAELGLVPGQVMRSIERKPAGADW